MSPNICFAAPLKVMAPFGKHKVRQDELAVPRLFSLSHRRGIERSFVEFASNSPFHHLLSCLPYPALMNVDESRKEKTFASSGTHCLIRSFLSVDLKFNLFQQASRYSSGNRQRF